jgi:hypothetical protein
LSFLVIRLTTRLFFQGPHILIGFYFNNIVLGVFASIIRYIELFNIPFLLLGNAISLRFVEAKNFDNSKSFDNINNGQQKFIFDKEYYLRYDPLVVYFILFILLNIIVKELMRTSPKHRLPLLLNNIQAKRSALFLQKLVLFESDPQSDGSVRHYDYDCEGM